MTRDEKLPPYTATNERERQEMIDWVCQKLHEDEERMFTPLINALSAQTTVPTKSWRYSGLGTAT
jgi:hypothetical protein